MWLLCQSLGKSFRRVESMGKRKRIVEKRK
jgi:hypothetical protein